MGGKRGRSINDSREKKTGTSNSYDSYFKKHKVKMKPDNPNDVLDRSLNKKWVKDNLKQNKDYATANKIDSKQGNWDTVYKNANKSGINTKSLESIASRSSDPHSMNEYGFKPHVQALTKQVAELKKGGYMPNTTIDKISVRQAKETVMGSYSSKDKAYMININSLSVPRIEKAMRAGGLAGNRHKDVVTHEIGHAVFKQNMVKPKVVKINGKKQRKKASEKEKAIRSAYAKVYTKLRKELRKNEMQGLSKYVSKHAKARKTGADKITRSKSRKATYSDGFSEGYVNYVRFRQGKGNLHPVGKAVGDFIKEINKYK